MILQVSGPIEDYNMIPGIDDYSPGYYAITVLIWVVLIAVVVSLAIFVINLVKNNFTKTTAKAINVTAQVAEKIATEVRQSSGQQLRSKREEDAFALAAQELELGNIQKGLWAKAFADANGDEQRQKALYLRYRADQIRKDHV